MLRLADRGTRTRVTGALPTVNLLPASVFEAMAVRRLRRRFLLALIALVAVTAAVWGLLGVRIAAAESREEEAMARGAVLTAEVAELAPVREFTDAVARQEATVTTTMASEVLMSQVLAGLSAATPQGVSVESLGITLDPATVAAVLAAAEAAPEGEAGATPDATTPGGASGQGTADLACAGPDPFGTSPLVACVTLSGTAESRAAVGQLVIELGSAELFVEPFVTTTNAEQGQVNFAGTVGLDVSAVSGRYADLSWILANGAEQ